MDTQATRTHSRSPLKLGIQVNTTQRVFRWSEIADQARAAEAAGLDSLWTEDHLFYTDKDGRTIGPWEAWTVLAGLAQVCSLRIGTMVSPVTMRAPLLLAKAAATVDEMSEGRLVLGIGAGWAAGEFGSVGAPFDHRVSRFEEAMEVLLRLFETGHVRHDGTYLRVEGSLEPRAAVRPRPELMVGSLGPRMLRSTLPYVDGWNWDGFHFDLDDFANDLKVVRAAADDVGRDLGSLSISAHMVARFAGAQGLPVKLPPDMPVLEGSDEELGRQLREVHDAGIDEVQLIVDPLEPAAIEALGRAAARARAT